MTDTLEQHSEDAVRLKFEDWYRRFNNCDDKLSAEFGWRAGYQAGLAAQEEWQPIETAPRGDQQILTFRHAIEGCTIGGRSKNWYQTSFWFNVHKCFVGWPQDNPPTHWMPLPPNPKD